MWSHTPGTYCEIDQSIATFIYNAQDYTHWIKADRGVQSDVTEQLMKAANVEALKEWQKYVAVCFDEVKVKEGIVYDKHDCRVVGFVDFGDVNNAMLEFERSADAGRPEIAKQMLVFILLSNEFPLRTALKPLHGNCRKRKENHVIAVDETPLPKRKRSNR